MQLFGCGVWLPKAQHEFINQVLALSSFSVTLLRLDVYYLLIHGIKQI
jgi:formate hydrogenlyase subunit 3/multisubunit Na+/H+ antiporter MnhD subunit